MEDVSGRVRIFSDVDCDAAHLTVALEALSEKLIQPYIERHKMHFDPDPVVELQTTIEEI